MNNSFERLVDGMVATLRTEVLPRLADEFARGQVFGVINVLNNLRIRADWAPGLLHEQLGIQRRAFASIGALLAQEAAGAAAPPMPQGEPPAIVAAADLQALRDDGDRAICAMLAWLSGARDSLPAAVGAGIEEELRRAMRAENDLEIRSAARPMFAEMAQGGEG